MLYSAAVLLLRCENLALDIGEMIRLRLAPRLLCTSFRFEIGHLRCCQLLSVSIRSAPEVVVSGQSF